MKSVHLLVCIHGMWGKPDHLDELVRIIRAKYPSGNGDVDSAIDLDVLVATSNREDWTYDGIDWGAARLADEVRPSMTDRLHQEMRPRSFDASWIPRGSIPLGMLASAS